MAVDTRSAGESGPSSAQRYRTMAEQELRGKSPTYEVLAQAVADDAEICALLDLLPPAQRQPNLLFAATRLLGGPISEPRRFLQFVRTAWADLEPVLRRRRTQTNEVGRCAVLLPLLAALPGPLALIEVGASAGLCLYPDRFAYRYGLPHGTFSIGAGPVRLPCRVTGPLRPPSRLPPGELARGPDLNPLDVNAEPDLRWLECLIWPEQSHRLERLRAAASLVRGDRPWVHRGDLLTDLPDLVGAAPDGATVVVFHSAVLAYLSPTDRTRFAATMTGLIKTRGVHWIANEGVGVWPMPDGPEPGDRDHSGRPVSARFVLSHNSRPVARSDPHGAELDWLPSVDRPPAKERGARG